MSTPACLTRRKLLEESVIEAERFAVDENKRFVRLGNVAEIVGQIFERDVLDEPQQKSDGKNGPVGLKKPV